MAVSDKLNSQVLNLLACADYSYERKNRLFIVFPPMLGINHEDGLAAVLIKFVIHERRLGQSNVHLVCRFLAVPVNDSSIERLSDALQRVFVCIKLRVVPSLNSFEVLHAINNFVEYHAPVFLDFFALKAQE